ncbi:MAG TPA: hypothetical protein VEC16_05515 [Alphaproteobacteria bacterium]|nr:hypothetical protein [Alphaproteobacteria bacterium]
MQNILFKGDSVDDDESKYKDDDDIIHRKWKETYKSNDKSFTINHTRWSNDPEDRGSDHRCYGDYDSMIFKIKNKTIFSYHKSCHCHSHPEEVKMDYINPKEGKDSYTHEYSIDIVHPKSIDTAINLLKNELMLVKKQKSIDDVIKKSGKSREELRELLA